MKKRVVSLLVCEMCIRDRARDVISKHRYVLEECAKQLITKEKLNRQEFEAIFEQEAEGPEE